MDLSCYPAPLFSALLRVLGVSAMRDHPAGVRWNCAATAGKNEPRSRFQLRHWMDTEERSTRMILNELSSPRPRVEVAVPAWITSAECPGIL